MYQWYYLWKYPTSIHTTIEEEEWTVIIVIRAVIGHFETGYLHFHWLVLKVSPVCTRSAPQSLGASVRRRDTPADWHKWTQSVGAPGTGGPGAGDTGPARNTGVLSKTGSGPHCPVNERHKECQPGCQNTDCQCHDTQTVSEVAIHRLSVE